MVEYEETIKEIFNAGQHEDIQKIKEVISETDLRSSEKETLYNACDFNKVLVDLVKRSNLFQEDKISLLIYMACNIACVCKDELWTRGFVNECLEKYYNHLKDLKKLGVKNEV